MDLENEWEVCGHSLVDTGNIPFFDCAVTQKTGRKRISRAHGFH